MSYKKAGIFTAAIILLAVAIFSLSDDILTQYVSIEAAKMKPGKSFQIIGKVDKSKPVKHTEKEFYFSIIDDKNSKVDIVYRGIKPQNFDRADQIVSIGKYNSEKNIFEAEKLLVKCPSKYVKKYEEKSNR